MNPNIKFSLTAIEAKDLMAGDSNGLSDPYFKIPHKQRGVIDLPKKTNRTKTIMKTLNPKWNHTFECEFNPQACNKLAIEVYEYDFIGKDDLIETMVNSIVICHNYIRNLYDRSSVSLRELKRFRILFEYFISY